MSAKPDQHAESVVSGIFHNRSTMETQVWLDGRCIGACAIGQPLVAFHAWLRGIVSRLSPGEVVRVYGGRHSDGSSEGGVAAAKKALGHARGALLAVADSVIAGRGNELKPDALIKFAQECDEARALLNDGQAAGGSMDE